MKSRLRAITVVHLLIVLGGAIAKAEESDRSIRPLVGVVRGQVEFRAEQWGRSFAVAMGMELPVAGSFELDEGEALDVLCPDGSVVVVRERGPLDCGAPQFAKLLVSPTRSSRFEELRIMLPAGASIYSRRPQFTWTSVEGVDEYGVEIVEAATQKRIASGPSAPGSSPIPTDSPDLEPGRLYELIVDADGLAEERQRFRVADGPERAALTALLERLQSTSVAARSGHADLERAIFRSQLFRTRGFPHDALHELLPFREDPRVQLLIAKSLRYISLHDSFEALRTMAESEIPPVVQAASLLELARVSKQLNQDSSLAAKRALAIFEVFGAQERVASIKAEWPEAR